MQLGLLLADVRDAEGGGEVPQGGDFDQAEHRIRRVAEAVDQDAVEAGFHGPGLLVPLDVLGRRAGADGIGRLAAGVGRQPAAALVHHAQAAEAEDLDFHLGVADDVLDLGQRQHARQYRAADAEFAAAEVDCFVAGGRALHRQVQALLRVAPAGVVEESDIGQDDRVHAEVYRGIDRLVPVADTAGLREGVDRQQHLATFGMGVTDAVAHGLRIEIEAGEIACVGIVLEAEIHGVGAIVDGGLEGRQAAGRTDEVGQLGHGWFQAGEARKYSDSCRAAR